jgi:predicted TIM-barrel fold metal-dependent hydrolase
MAVVDESREVSKVEQEVGYRLFDADQHSTIPNHKLEGFIDPKHKDKAIRTVIHPDGRREVLFAGRPQRLVTGSGVAITQIVGSDDVLARNAGTDDEEIKQAFFPGKQLTRLNPLKGLTDDERRDFVKRYRAMQDHLDDPATRLPIMDAQGIATTVNYAFGLGLEYEFEDDLVGLYANLRAGNRAIANIWQFNHDDRIITPPFISLKDPEAALAELNACMADGPLNLVQISSGPAIDESPFRPELDEFWSICNEAGINFCNHLANVTFYGRQGEAWSEPEAILGDMTAFQWVMYYGDRPAYETAAAAILQGFFNRYPNVRFLLSEQGTVWVPYFVRKMDHAYFMGRRVTWGKLEMRPSEYFRKHIVVAPFPEENVDRVIEAVGVEPLVFGSDFPHGEGLPDPAAYLAQLQHCDDDQKRAILRGNLAGFLGIEHA